MTEEIIIDGKRINWKIIAIVIIAITAIEITALLNGINGTMMSMVLIILAGLGGYQVKGWCGK